MHIHIFRDACVKDVFSPAPNSFNHSGEHSNKLSSAD